MYSVGKVAQTLGITYDGALKLMHRLGIGERHGRLWVVDEKGLEAMKWNCERYTKRALGSGFVSHTKANRKAARRVKTA